MPTIRITFSNGFFEVSQEWTLGFEGDAEAGRFLKDVRRRLVGLEWADLGSQISRFSCFVANGDWRIRAASVDSAPALDLTSPSVDAFLALLEEAMRQWGIGGMIPAVTLPALR